MNSAMRQKMLDQLDYVLAYRDDLKSRSKYHEEFSDMPDGDLHRLATMGRAAVERLTGTRSTYARQIEAALAENTHFPGRVALVTGVIESLRADVDAGFAESLEELIHADLFSDFLEMAKHLLSEGYKDAAAVIVGSSLEAHLRQLAAKYAVPIEFAAATGLKPKKADQLNADLAAAGAYSKLDQKTVTSWLDLRNKAAHGQYAEYTKEQVALMLQGVRDFIARNPA